MESIIVREIYSEDNQLLCSLRFIDFNKVLINFLHPVVTHISQDSQHYKNIFLNETISKLAEEIPELGVSYKLYKDTRIIESIEITGLKSIKDFDIIMFKTMELLSNEKEFGVSSKIERTFYSLSNELLCHIFYLDFNHVFIKFAKFDHIQVDSESEAFQKTFIKDTLTYLKKELPEIEIDYHYYGDSKILKSIEILNIKSLRCYDYITAKIMELLGRIEKPYLFE